ARPCARRVRRARRGRGGRGDSGAGAGGAAMSASSTLSTLERGIAILQFVAEHGPVTAKRVAREMNLKPSSCYHVLRTLVGCGFLARLEDGTYGVGPKSHAYAKTVQAKYAIQPELAVILTRL